MEQVVVWRVRPRMKALTIAAIASNLALGFEMELAVEKAIDYVQGAISQSYSLGEGNGPLNHLYRQRILPFTPYIYLNPPPNHSGKFYEYLLNHPRVKQTWYEYTRKPPSKSC